MNFDRRTYKYAFTFLLLHSNYLYAQIPEMPNMPFYTGETLEYKIEFWGIDLGESQVSIATKMKSIDKKLCYNFEIKGETIGMARFFNYKVHDTWGSYFEAKTLRPVLFYRDIYENGYTCVEETFFNHEDNEAFVKQTVRGKYKENHYRIASNTQDMVTGFYVFRTIDLTSFDEGDTICIDGFFEDESYDFKVIYLGTDRIRIPLGRGEAYVFSPVMPDNQVFRGEHPLKIWLSKDENKIPLRFSAKMLVGSASVTLSKHKNLKYDLKLD